MIRRILFGSNNLRYVADSAWKLCSGSRLCELCRPWSAAGVDIWFVFGFALPVIVIVLLLVIFCVHRKRRAASKRRQPIVSFNRGVRMDRVHNSYDDIAVPQATELELRPLQPAPTAYANTRDEEPVKGVQFVLLLLI